MPSACPDHGPAGFRRAPRGVSRPGFLVDPTARVAPFTTRASRRRTLGVRINRARVPTHGWQTLCPEVDEVAGSKAITTYLNDHLAGATAALDLLSTVREHAPTTTFEGIIDGVTAEIEQDRDVLLGIAGRLDADTGVVKQAAAKVAQKALQ